jgi:hypothetical protein
MVAMSICYLSLWLYAITGRRLLREDSDPRTVSGITKSYLPGAPTYLTATLIALVSPLTSVALFGAIALFYVVDSSFFGDEVIAGAP